MTIEEIKHLVDIGGVVYWIDKKHRVVKVIEGDKEEYLIKSIDWNSYVSLTNKDGTLAGNKEENYFT